MSRKGNCYDNCVIENFFGLLKTEFFHNQSFTSVEHFQKELDQLHRLLQQFANQG